MATYGFAFRGTAGYVTDGANTTYVLGETSAQTRNGITFHWTATGGSWTAPNPGDVDNTVDVRLAGGNFAPGTTTAEFNVTLPAAGTYDVRLAIGYAGTGGGLVNQQVRLRDGGTLRLTVGPTNVADASFMDAAGVVYTNANWPGSNSAVNLTFTSTTFTLELEGATSLGCLGYLSLTQAAAAIYTGLGLGGSQKAYATFVAKAASGTTAVSGRAALLGVGA